MGTSIPFHGSFAIAASHSCFTVSEVSNEHAGLGGRRGGAAVVAWLATLLAVSCQLQGANSPLLLQPS